MPSLKEVIDCREAMYKKSLSLVYRKGNAYNRRQQLAGETLFNLRVCAMLGVVPSAEMGVLVRLCDKLMRLISLVQAEQPSQPGDDSLEDTVADIHNYIDYALLFYRERFGQPPLAPTPDGLTDPLRRTSLLE